VLSAIRACRPSADGIRQGSEDSLCSEYAVQSFRRPAVYAAVRPGVSPFLQQSGQLLPAFSQSAALPGLTPSQQRGGGPVMRAGSYLLHRRSRPMQERGQLPGFPRGVARGALSSSISACEELPAKRDHAHQFRV